MVRSPSPLFWMTATVALSALVALAVSRQVAGPAHTHEPAGDHADAFHAWLHEQLEITPEQEEQLAPIEHSYAEERKELQRRIDGSGQRLARALEDPEGRRNELDAALAEIRAAQGQLQGLTIHHFLEMKSHLSPDQAAKLLQWTRESIVNEHHHP